MAESDAMSDPFEAEVIPSAISKNSKQREQLKKLAKRALYLEGLDPRNFSIVTRPGGKVVFRFGDERATVRFKIRLPESVIP